jgi:hypothetical protein
LKFIEAETQLHNFKQALERLENLEKIEKEKANVLEEINRIRRHLDASVSVFKVKKSEFDLITSDIERRIKIKKSLLYLLKKSFFRQNKTK